MSLVSIVVPVYNTEKYLKESLDSITAQTYKNLEIILVNDGSTDLSGSICDLYAQKDSRIIVIHSKNNGAGTARNLGIEKASGEYCLFIDSDDTVSCDYVEFLYDLLEKYNVEVAMCAIEHKKRRMKGDLQEQCMFGNKKIFEFFLNSKIYAVYVRIVKTSLIKQLKFCKYARAEDALFSAQLFLKLKRIAISPEVKYFYRHNLAGISYCSVTLKILDELLVGKDIMNLTHENYCELDFIAEKNYKMMVDNLLSRIIRHKGFFLQYQERKFALDQLVNIVERDFLNPSNLGIKYFSATHLPVFLLPFDFRIKCCFARMWSFFVK